VNESRSPAISDDAGLFALEPAMHVQSIDPDADRWARIVLQLSGMRAIMRMRPAS
jgi:hypothetical protein